MIEIRSAEFMTGATSLSSMPPDGRPEIAFAGRSNVGKSSLINMLLGRRNLARTSRTPGKTREVNFFLINDAFFVVDLPGLGFAKVSRAQRNRWQSAITGYLGGRQGLRLLFHLIDSRHPPMAADLDLAQLYRKTDVPAVILLTKVDKLSGNQRATAERRVRESMRKIGLELPVILTSSKSGRGRDEILGWIEEVALV